MGHGDQAAGPQQTAELREARDRLAPEQHRVDGQDPVERRVELGQLVDRAEPQVDHSTPEAVGIAPPRPAQHQL